MVVLAEISGKPVALKVFRQESVSPPFGREVCELLDGPGLIPVLDWGRLPDGEVWQASPLVDPWPDSGSVSAGGPGYVAHTLDRRLGRLGTLPPGEVVEIGRTIATGLVRLHRNGWIHGDIKPGNIAYLDGNPVLIDYGLLRNSGTPFDRSGTPGYVPIQGSSDHGADVYALGLTLYETWTGLHREEYPSLPAAVVTHPSWSTQGRHLNGVIQQMVRDFNPITAEDARDQLDRILTGKVPAPRDNRVLRFQAAGLVVLLLLAAGILQGRRHGLIMGPPPSVARAVSLGGQFVDIPGGPFLMGRNSGDSDTNAPQVEVTVDAFQIQRTEVPFHLWTEVRDWALQHGYSDLNTGSGRDADYPVIWVQWFDAVKWCNAWSEKEGLKPCYHLGPRFEKSQVYRTNDVHIRSEWVDWTANGYRLPTEAEWEKAARGGVEGFRYFWGDTITHDNANYRSVGDLPYDLSPTQEFHPRYSATKMPFASPIGSFPPNAFGLYDTSGNLWEWTWDAYDPTGYRVPPPPNPRGAPVYLAGRVIKGGCWNNSAYHARPTFRGGHGAEGHDPFLGFRCARNGPVPALQSDR